MTFSGGGTPTTPAQAFATVYDGAVTVQLSNPGAGYTSDPTVTISPPPALQAAAQAVVESDGTIAKVNVISAGAGYGATAPQAFLIGSGSGASATAVLTNDGVSSITVNSPGSGYAIAPFVSFSGGGGSGAAATAQINDAGQVVGFIVTAAGSGYTSSPTITITGGDGFTTPAVLSASLSGGSVAAIKVSPTAIGAGFISTPTVYIAPPPVGITLSGSGTVTLPIANDSLTGPSNVNGVNLILGSTTGLGLGTLNLNSGTIAGTVPLTFTNPVNFSNSQLSFTGNEPITFGTPLAVATATALNINGQIDDLTLTYGGAGYSSVPTVNIVSSGNGGSGATAQAVVSDGAIVGIDLTNAGSGYTQNPKITFTFASANDTVTLGSGTIGGNTNSITANNTGGVDFASRLTGPGNIVTSGSSTISFTNNSGTASNYTGLTTVASGTLYVDASAGLGATAAGEGTVVDSGEALQLGGDRIVANALNLKTFAEPITINGNGAGNGGARR